MIDMIVTLIRWTQIKIPLVTSSKTVPGTLVVLIAVPLALISGGIAYYFYKKKEEKEEEEGKE